ncbi:50S ribosomal protein L5 [Candidatus Woesebacteria bacterium]|nr:MAG: 50S ribosomal protein L5 [Candidatus Woesebacteria bacterium]
MKLQEKYIKEIVPILQKEFGIKNCMATPKLEKIVVNMGVGDASKNKELLAQVQKDIAEITGQAPSVRLAKLSVASFSLREGSPVGLKVTLRKERMYDFFQKLVAVVLPRLRDFRGVSVTSFDQHGNYNLGIRDYSVFPEIDIAKSGGRGLEITVVTNGKDEAQSKRLLDLLGMPFEKVSE